MPTVPLYGQRRVATEALPGVRVSPDVPADAFQPATPVDLSGLKRLVASVWHDEQQKANQIAITDADRQLSDAETDLLYHPQTGLLNRHGKDAFSAPEDAQTGWSQAVAKIEGTLANDAQREAFQQLVASREPDMRRTVEQHVSNEMRDYDTQVTNSYLTSARNEAIANYSDPNRVDLSVAKQTAVIRDHAKRNGLPQEWIDAKIADTTSGTYAAVINRMLASGHDQAATDYYQKVRDRLVGSDAVSVEKAVDEGSTRGESQRRADAIVQHATSRIDALVRVRQIKDPKLRDATEDRVNQFYTEKRTAEAEQRDALYLQATNLVDQQPGVPARNVVPPHLWTQLTLEQRSALERRGDNPTNDDHRWLAFLDLRPQKLGAMSQAQFETEYWAHFDGPHRERAAEQWAQARDAVKAQNFQTPKLVATLNFKDRVSNTLKAAGLIDPNKSPAKYSDDEAMFYSEFETEAAKRVQQYEFSQLGGKRPATGEEIQGILNKLVTQRVFIDKSWGSDPEKLVALVPQNERGQAYVPFKRIPVDKRNFIQSQIQKAGKAVTQHKIERAYAAFLFNDSKLYKDIINE